MKQCLLKISILLISISSWSQDNTLSPEKATEIIRSKDYEKMEPNEFNLDSVGIKIIRTLFSDKANHPDRISKKDYLDNPLLHEIVRNHYSLVIEGLKNPEVRKRAYTLTEEDSLLVSGNIAKGRQWLWKFSAVDSTVAPNPYYQFFLFSIRTDKGRGFKRLGFVPFVVIGIIDGGIGTRDSYITKLNAIIYDSKFIVGIPKVHLINNNKVDLPLILLGRDFISYPSNQMLLENVLKSSGYSDSTARSLLVYLDASANYRLKKFNSNSIPCQDFNPFNRKSCYQFSVIIGREYREYIATINKSNEISYALVEEPQNLMPYVESVFKNRYPKSENKHTKITFKLKRGRRFIYEIYTHEYNPQKRKMYKAVYNRGRVSFDFDLIKID